MYVAWVILFRVLLFGTTHVNFVKCQYAIKVVELMMRRC